jgi:hypothetical protein
MAHHGSPPPAVVLGTDSQNRMGNGIEPDCSRMLNER